MDGIKLFESLVGKADFVEVDSQFVKRIAFYFPEIKKEALAAFFLLMASYRQGHLCLPLERSFLEMFLLPGEDRELSKQMISLACNSKEHFPEDIIEILLEEKEYTPKPFVLFNGNLYFQKNWIFETKIINHVRRLLSAPLPSVFTNFDVHSHPLREDQKTALQKALASNICLLTGGPGTGKTYTAAHIVNAFLQYKKDAAIILAAPTGKAAMRLESSFSQQEYGEATFRFGTLHNILQIRSWKDQAKEGAPLEADMILVDECSMIDAGMFSCLLSRIREGTKVVLLGDDHQLSPVETGTIFADMVQFSKIKNILPLTELINPARFEEKKLVQIAEEIKLGKVETLFEIVRPLEEEPLFSYLHQKVHRSYVHPDLDPKSLLQTMEITKILSCMRKGPFGVDSLNQQLAQKYFSQIPIGENCVIPIMVTRTDYELDLYNGETGLLIRKKQSHMHDKVFDAQDYAIFRGQDQGPIRKIQAALLPSFEYAYCISVHKSQGSEYDEAIIIVPKGSEAFGKEVLYTAFTRARKQVEIFGEKEIVTKILHKNNKKCSGIVKRLSLEWAVATKE